MYVADGLIFTALVAGVLYLLRDLFEKCENPSRFGDNFYSDENGKPCTKEPSFICSGR
jgi:hypothetical protein